MIRIERCAAPAGHAPRAAAALIRLRAAAAANGGKPDRERDLEDVFKHAGVRQALHDMQHGKCCYCERDIEIAWHPVEHYRPFAKYWWLAYTWTNLLAACNPCNTTGKSDNFPLGDETLRLQPENAPPGLEQPLVLDPASAAAGDDPERHLTFVQEPNGDWIIAPKDGSRRGETTIAVLKLNRSELKKKRDKYAPDFVRLRDNYRSAVHRADAAAGAMCRVHAQACKASSKHFALLARVILAEVP